MGYPLKNSKKRTKHGGLKPGTYFSEITAVEDAKGYRSGDAFSVCYALVEEQSAKAFTKTEVFFNDTNNPRTKALLDYLADHGVEFDNTDDLLGLSEKLTLGYEIDNGVRYLNVINREFVSSGII